MAGDNGSSRPFSCVVAMRVRRRGTILASCLGSNCCWSGVIRPPAIAPPWVWPLAWVDVLKQGEQFFDIAEKPRLFGLKMGNLPPESGHASLLGIIVAHRGLCMQSACLMAQKIFGATSF